MSFITFDLNCEDGHWEIGVLYRRSVGPPPCPDCGKPCKPGNGLGIHRARAHRATPFTVEQAHEALA